MSEKSLKKNAVFTFLKAFFSICFPLISFPYASRILRPDGIGKVNFANSIISIFTLIAGLGLNSYGIREISKVQNNKILLSKTLKELLLINFFSTIFSYALFILSLIFVPKFNEYSSLLILCSLNIIFTTLGVDWFYRGLEDFKYITIRSFIFQIISLIFLFLFVKTKNDIFNYAMIGIISSVGSNICNIIHLRDYFILKTPKLEIKKHIKPIFIFFGIAVSISIYTLLDTTMIGFFKDDFEVGLYSAANKINKIVLSLITAVTAILLPRLSYYYKNEIKKFYFLLNKSVHYILIISIPSAVGLYIISDDIILLFSGIEYLEASISMRIMTPIIIFISLSNFLNGQLLVSINKEKIGFLTYILSAIINFTLNFILIPPYGAIGASIGTVITEGIVATIQFIYTKKYFNKRKLLKTIFQCLIGIISFFIISFFINKIIHNLYIRIIFNIFICCAIYIIVLLLFKNKQIEEIIYIIKNKLKRN